MLKRIISCLIIISMLWGDIAAAMNDEEEVKTPSSRRSSLIIKGTNTPPKNGTTEVSPLLNGTNGATYHTTPMTEIVSLSHSINGKRGSKSSSSDEEDRREDSRSSDERIGDGKTDKKKCPSCWVCRKKQENRLVIRIDSSDSEDERPSVDSHLFDEEEKKCCSPWSWPSCCKKKGGEEDVESSGVSKTGCWPFSCCTKGSSGKHIGESDSLLIIERDPSLVELKKQLLLRLVVPLEEDNSSDVLHLEEQYLEEQDLLLQKARFLFQKIQGTSLEDFGRWFQGHVVENRYRWQDWGGILIALGMAAGTGSAMSPIVIWSLYNKYFSKYLKGGNTSYDIAFMSYIIGSTALTSLTDAVSFMPEVTSPSTNSFITPKSAREKRADRALISLAAIPGIYLLLLGFQIQQEHKKATGTTGWWNQYDRLFYFNSLGFFPYLVAQTWKGMRTAISRVFHPMVPGHVKERVLALQQLDARLDHLSDDKVDDLYDLLKDPLYAPNSKFKAWSLYLCQGEVADLSKVEGLLSYLSLTKYAQENFKEEMEVDEAGHKTKIASRVLAGFGLPAGFGLVAISVFGMLNAFMDWKAALALSITAATLGFAPEAFLQAHNVQETLDDISAKESGPKRGWKENVKDPYWWGTGAAKVVGTIWSFLQNSLTNLAPIFVSLALLIPEQLGGSDTLQTAMTTVMITLAVPYLISELLSGTHDMWGHLVSMTYAVHDFFYGIYDRIVECCGKKLTPSPRRQRREIRRILKQAIETTLRFTPEHVDELDKFEKRLEGKEVVN